MEFSLLKSNIIVEICFMTVDVDTRWFLALDVVFPKQHTTACTCSRLDALSPKTYRADVYSRTNTDATLVLLIGVDVIYDTLVSLYTEAIIECPTKRVLYRQTASAPFDCRIEDLLLRVPNADPDQGVNVSYASAVSTLGAMTSRVTHRLHQYCKSSLR